MVNYVKGDLMKAPEEVLGHGVNCSGGFGSGVAKLMAEQHPETRRRYMGTYEGLGWSLGSVQIVKSGEKWILNCATQNAYLPRGVCHADYSAIRMCMETAKEFARISDLKLAIPRIGAGLAGGDWVIIEKILNEVFNDFDVTVYHLD